MSHVIADWLLRQASSHPEQEAVVAGGRSLTYGELDERVASVAAGLAAAGVGRGDRVAVLARNSLELVEVVHALPRLGAVLMPINLRLTAAEIAWQLEDSRAARVLAHPDNLSLAKEAAHLAGLEAPVALPVLGSGGPPPIGLHGADDTHSLIYTSGTTGRPKGAILTYANFLASAIGSAQNLGVAGNDRWLACLPLFHVGGLSIVLRSVIYGTSIVVAPGFDEASVARSLVEDRITLVSLVPTMLRRLLEASPGRAPESLRAALIGGGPVPRPLLEAALERGYRVVQTYGLTEAASQVATLSIDDAIAHTGAAGRPLVTVEMRVDAAAGEAGEILVRGPVVSPGYVDGNSVSPSRDTDGWFHTGDIGRLDGDGFLYVLDRRDDLIVSGGENVYPAEVEAVLLGHPKVTTAAVVGLQDPEWGQIVAAAIVAVSDFEESELAAWARGRLAAYKVPRRWLAVSELPETASGKVRRHAVREMFAAPQPPRT
ncbi:MAG: o-succinylbenzoate--CoA ligase [Dehalococcoidia bacterium]